MALWSDSAAIAALKFGAVMTVPWKLEKQNIRRKRNFEPMFDWLIDLNGMSKGEGWLTVLFYRVYQPFLGYLMPNNEFSISTVFLFTHS